MIKNFEELQNAPAYYVQVFPHKFSHYVEKSAIINAMDSNEFNKIDMEIFKFLFKFKYATVEQIYKYLTYKELINNRYSLTELQSKLNSLISLYRALNKFGIAMSETETFSENANTLIIYCLDIGGQFLLYNYSDMNLDEVRNWRVKSANIHTPNIIYKDIFITELYLRVLSKHRDNLKYFTPYRRMTNSLKETVTVDFDFMIEIDGVRKYFFGDIMRENIYSHTTQMDFVEYLTSSNLWKKYYSNIEAAPMYICITENEELMKEAGEFLSQRDIGKFRVSNFNAMLNDMSMAFYSYNKETNTLENKLVKLFA